MKAIWNSNQITSLVTTGFLSILLLPRASMSQETAEDNKVQIAGIFDTNNIGWGEELFHFTMKTIQSGDQWLMDLIPPLAENSSRLNSMELSYDIRNANCDETTAVRAYWDLRSNNEGKLPPHGLVGAYCSGASISLARISGLEQVTQISPFSTSSRLSDKEEFPYFARMMAPDDERGEVGAFVAALRLYGWDRISILATDSQFAKDWVKEFSRLWEGNQGTWTGDVASSFTIRIQLDGSIDEDSVRQGLRATENQENNPRLILLAAHSQHAYPILEIADTIGFQPDTIWVGTSSWVGKQLDRHETSWMPRHPGYLGVVPFRNDDDVYQTFLSMLRQEQRTLGRDVWDTLPIFGPQLVDSIIAMVITLVLVAPSQLRNGTVVLRTLKTLDFEGVSGRVHFTDAGDLKDPQFSITQLRDYSGQNSSWDTVGFTGTQVGTARSEEGSDLCFPGAGCVRATEVPDDSYPVPEDSYPVPGYAIAIIVVVFLLLVALGLKYWRSRRSKRSYKEELDAFRDSVVGMRTAETHYLPTVSTLEDDIEKARGHMGKLVLHPQAKIIWCWRETNRFMHKHEVEVIEGDPADCWIRYDDDINSKLETAFQAQKGDGVFSPLPGYSVVFAAMSQIKLETGFQRAVQRLVVAPPAPKEGPRTIDLKGAQVGDRMPSDIHSEPQMVLVKGDVVQISKQRSDGWGFGTKLYHEDEAVARELVAHVTGDASEDEANIFADTGWFQLDATCMPSAEDLAALKKNVGDTGALEAPSNWDDVVDPTVAQQHRLKKGDAEYDSVVNAFMSTLQNRTIKNIKVVRIQNLAMWQSYVVKRQTICYRETVHRSNDKSDSANDDAIQHEAIDRFERCWLWHGTNAEVKDKILQQGFNRSFCGKNATMHGKGVYFARDASYSSYKTYAVPDDKGTQYVMACRVVVGEYCPGIRDALTPDIRDPKTQSLYDSSVGLLTDDTMTDPSIYVTYHDAQAYPEYLITFNQA